MKVKFLLRSVGESDIEGENPIKRLKHFFMPTFLPNFGHHQSKKEGNNTLSNPRMWRELK